jgi:hypothetical protein
MASSPNRRQQAVPQIALQTAGLRRALHRGYARARYRRKSPEWQRKNSMRFIGLSESSLVVKRFPKLVPPRRDGQRAGRPRSSDCEPSHGQRLSLGVLGAVAVRGRMTVPQATTQRPSRHSACELGQQWRVADPRLTMRPRPASRRSTSPSARCYAACSSRPPTRTPNRWTGRACHRGGPSSWHSIKRAAVLGVGGQT